MTNNFIHQLKFDLASFNFSCVCAVNSNFFVLNDKPGKYLTEITFSGNEEYAVYHTARPRVHRVHLSIGQHNVGHMRLTA